MDKKVLVEADVDGGQRLVERLELAGLPISAAMWLKRPDDAAWRLYISSPNVEAFGPGLAYDLIAAEVEELGLELGLDDVVATNTTNHFVNAISSTFKFDDGMMLLENCEIGDLAIDGAVIYRNRSRVPPTAKPIVVRSGSPRKRA